MPSPIQKRSWKSAFRSIRTAEIKNFAREFFPSLARIAFHLVLPAQRFYSLRTRVVAALGADGHLSVAFGLGLDVHRAKAPRTPWIRRLVADGVLAADIAGHGAADLIHFIKRPREKGDATGALRHLFQSTSGAFRMLFLAQNPDGVDRRSVLTLQLFHGLLQSFEARVVFSVGHNKQHFLLQLRVSS